MANEFGPALTVIANGLKEPGSAAVDRSFLPSLINLGYSEGMSGRGMLSAFRAAGVTIADQAFWNLASDVRGGEANIKKVGNLDLAMVPTGADFAKWNTSHAEGYYYQVNVITTRAGIEPGSVDTLSKLWGYRSNVPLALGDVFSDLFDQITSYTEQASGAGEELVGMTLDNMYQMIP